MNNIGGNITNTIEQPQVKILWTGGFDSSFRMIQLSKHSVSIQPYYLSDNRRSEQKELNAIDAITYDIHNHPDTKCTILPLIKHNVTDIEPDIEISEAYHRLYKMTPLGSQYDWLARFAKTNIGLEICLEKSEAGRAHPFITKNGGFKKINDGHIHYAILDEEKSDPDLFKIFGNFRLPLPLFELTKLEELEEYKKLGFEHSINKTWFCFQPINNEPCGICNPCKDVVKKGLPFRLTPAGMNRHNTESKFGGYLWFKYYKKIRLRMIGY